MGLSYLTKAESREEGGTPLSKQWKKEQVWQFLVVLQLAQSDISCTTTARLFFFPVLTPKSSCGTLEWTQMRFLPLFTCYGYGRAAGRANVGERAELSLPHAPPTRLLLLLTCAFGRRALA